MGDESDDAKQDGLDLDACAELLAELIPEEGEVVYSNFCDPGSMAGDFSQRVYKWRDRYWVDNDVMTLTGPFETLGDVFDQAACGGDLLRIGAGNIEILSTEIAWDDLIDQLQVSAPDQVRQLRINGESFRVTSKGILAKLTKTNK